MSNPIISESDGGVSIIRFNNAAERNPLSVAVMEKIGAQLDRIEADNSINAVIITGSDRFFASGADLREIAEVSAAGAGDFARLGQALMFRIAEFRKPIAAAVNGLCFGGAFDLALSCHRRVASPDAVFCHPGVGLGIITGWGGTQRLPKLVGQGYALEILLTARRVTAAEALEMGLVEQISASPVEALMSDFEFVPANSADKQSSI